MAPSTPPSGDHCTICNKEVDATYQSNRNTTPDTDVIALNLARNELLLASRSVEQLLDVIRRADSQQLQSLLAAARSGLSQEQMLALFEQCAADIENAESK